MKSIDVYGFQSDNINELAQRLSGILNIEFSLHDSLYRGGAYYRSAIPGKEEFVLQRNKDLVDNELAEPEFPQFPILLYIDPTERSEEIRKQ